MSQLFTKYKGEHFSWLFIYLFVVVVVVVVVVVLTPPRRLLLPDAVVRVLVTVDVAHEPLPVQPAHDGPQRQAVV